MKPQFTILIAEDSADIRAILLRLLERGGYRALAVTNGEEALARYKTDRPDLVLLDLSMPILDGWDTLTAIRALPGGASVPVIAVTAHALRGDREAALAHGFNGYVSKPLEFQSLLALIAQLLATRDDDLGRSY